jgi:hypothetical protein
MNERCPEERRCSARPGSGLKVACGRGVTLCGFVIVAMLATSQGLRLLAWSGESDIAVTSEDPEAIESPPAPPNTATDPDDFFEPEPFDPAIPPPDPLPELDLFDLLLEIELMMLLLAEEELAFPLIPLFGSELSPELHNLDSSPQ